MVETGCDERAPSTNRSVLERREAIRNWKDWPESAMIIRITPQLEAATSCTTYWSVSQRPKLYKLWTVENSKYARQRRSCAVSTMEFAHSNWLSCREYLIGVSIRECRDAGIWLWDSADAGEPDGAQSQEKRCMLHFLQTGRVSSHFILRFRHVKQPDIVILISMSESRWSNC